MISSRAIFLILFLLVSLVRVSAQTNVAGAVPVRGQIRISVQGGNVMRISPNSAPNDPLVNLMMSQPQVDTDSPVSALAEFDPPRVAVGQRATLRIVLTTLSESVEMPEKIPSPAGLELQTGGRAMSFQNLGMKIQARSTFNYRARAKAPGTYSMAPFAVNVAGKKVMVPATQLIVVPAGTAMETPVELSLVVPQTEIYVGQSVPARVVLADPGDNSAQAMMHAQVIGEAFLTDTSYARLRREAVMVNGQPRTSIVSEVLVTPMREGKHQVIGQAYVILNRPVTTQLSQLPGYFPLFDSDPVTLNVKRVPSEGELPGYTGAIGKFELESPQLSTTEVRAGEPVTLRVGIKGEGNFARFTAPKLANTGTWQTFSPEKDSSPGSQMQQPGFAQFAYTMIPVSTRVTATPPIPFSYYDPAKKQYVDLTIPALPVKVTSPVGTIASGTSSGSTDSDDAQNNEPRLIMTGLMDAPGAGATTLEPLQSRPPFVALQILPAGALFGLWWRDRRRRFHELHPEVMRKRRARRALGRQLRTARRAAAAQDSPAFVIAAVGALRHAAAPHSAANPEALVCRDVLRELPSGTEHAEEECVRKLFHAADALHFTERLDTASILPQLTTDFERVAEKLKERL